MKKAKFLYILLVVTTIFFLSFRSSEDKSSGNLGDVKYSVLAEKEFREINGKGWMLLDNRATDLLRGRI